MNFSQMNMLSKQIVMSQMMQGRLTSVNMLLINIQMNQLMVNDEAECGLNPKSEDLGMSKLSPTDEEAPLACSLTCCN